MGSTCEFHAIGIALAGGVHRAANLEHLIDSPAVGWSRVLNALSNGGREVENLKRFALAQTIRAHCSKRVTLSRQPADERLNLARLTHQRLEHFSVAGVDHAVRETVEALPMTHDLALDRRQSLDSD
jgi:hypothetical protein